MGTNYYASGDTCEHCGRSDDEVHIGKSSFGWVFSLHVIPELGLIDLENWENYLADKKITNEYGDVVSYPELMKIIKSRKGTPFSKKNWTGFYKSEADFHAKNGSVRGPKGLLRHKLGSHCIAHGKGTWDCILGEFS